MPRHPIIHFHLIFLVTLLLNFNLPLTQHNVFLTLIYYFILHAILSPSCHLLHLSFTFFNFLHSLTLFCTFFINFSHFIYSPLFPTFNLSFFIFFCLSDHSVSHILHFLINSSPNVVDSICEITSILQIYLKINDPVKFEPAQIARFFLAKNISVPDIVLFFEPKSNVKTATFYKLFW